MDHVAITVSESDKTGHTFQPDYKDSEEPIQVVEEFDKTLTKKLTWKPWCFLTEFYRDFIAQIFKRTH
jgi:aromatic ring-opening dioxygenase catalytic subunit (LigB family)